MEATTVDARKEFCLRGETVLRAALPASAE